MSKQSSGGENRAELFNEAALKLIQAGESKQALRLLQKSIKIKGSYAPTYVLIGLAYQNLDDIDQAEEYFRRAIEIDPVSKDGFESLGLFLISHDRASEGVEWLQRYMELVRWQDKSKADLLYATLMGLKRDEDALEFLKTSWDETRDPDIGVFLARVLQERGQLADACQIFELVSIKKADHKSYSEYGRLLVKNQEYKKAIGVFHKAVGHVKDLYFESDKEYMDEFLIEETPSTDILYVYWHWIAYSHLMLNEEESAVKAVDDARSLPFMGEFGPSGLDSSDLILIIHVLEKMNYYHDLISFAEEHSTESNFGEKADPLLEEYYELWAEALFAIDNQDRAIEVIKEGIGKFPKSSTLFLSWYVWSDDEKKLEVLDQAIKSGCDAVPKAVFLDLKISFLLRSGDVASAVETIVEIQKSSNKSALLDTFIFIVTQNLIEGGEKGLLYQRIYEEVKTIFPHYSKLLRLDAWLELNMGNLHSAELIYKELLKKTLPESSYLEVLNNLGYAYLLQGKFQKAESALTEVITKKSSVVSEDSAMASSTIQTKRLEDIFDQPYWLGTAIFRNGKISPNTASPLPIKADVSDPNYRNMDPYIAAKVNLSALALAQNEYEKASQLGIDVYLERPQESFGYEILGAVADASGETRSAVNWWRAGLEHVHGYYQAALQEWIEEAIQSLN